MPFHRSPEAPSMPERKREYVRWYPPDVQPVAAEEIYEWASNREPPDQFGIYVHVPYCEMLCPFCPYSKRLSNPARIEAYVSALKREIALYARFDYLSNGEVPFVYFGGGTPSVLPVDAFDEILEAIRRAFDLTGAPEVSVEANPATATPDRLHGLRRLGVNRISLGVQSFDERSVRLVRTHHGGEARRLRYGRHRSHVPAPRPGSRGLDARCGGGDQIRRRSPELL